MLTVSHEKGGKTNKLSTSTSIQCEFSPVNNRRLADLCGPNQENIEQIEEYFDVEIHQRSNIFKIHGSKPSVSAAGTILNRLYRATESKEALSPAKIHLFLKESRSTQSKEHKMPTSHQNTIKTDQLSVRPRGEHQVAYIKHIREHAINFGIGPAGTGKTFLAVACGIEALRQEKVKRLIFVRPAVEAGENLGFLPGDLQEKILPYLRPLYDALYDMLGVDNAAKLIENNTIELAPLAYMRGRTLNDAFIILDEAQNTTTEQMKMFLTRIGFGSVAVITGDITQIDLKRGIKSGLTEAIDVLKDIDAITFNYFDSKDTVRHPLVQSVIEAYDEHDKTHKEEQ